MARDDIDFVVCLGDYVYGEAYHSVAGGTGVRDDAIGEPNPSNPDIASEALTLADYRAKYALYRSDKALRDLHAKFPMVAIWDDHEVQDNYAGARAGRRPRRGQALVGGAPRRRLQGLLRGDAVLRGRATTASTAPSGTAATST